MPINKIKSVCVYCGSRSGTDPAFTEDARELGKLLAQNGIDLVYGGASIGVMGVIASAVMEHGGHVTGVIPHGLFRKEVANDGISKLLVVDSMHDRKSLMASMSDALITLPGGYGTLEELFEMITWNQLNIHNKPIYILNTNGFYDPLQSFIEHMMRKGFVSSGIDQPYRLLDTPAGIIEALSSIEPKNVPEPAVNP